MSWRLAKSLTVLHDQINKQFPGRSIDSDGTIGDQAHAARHSDHNPNSHGVVQAMDITNDPRHGLVSRKLAEALIATKDPRLKYVISIRQIAEAKHGFKWTAYSGINPHEHHCHISVSDDPQLYDQEQPWKFDYAADPKAIVEAKKLPSPKQVLKLGDAGKNVEDLQLALNAKYELRLRVDGRFGEETKKAIVQIQRTAEIVPDGVVGPATWKVIDQEPAPGVAE